MRNREILWREHKYSVMYHSQKHYNLLRKMMREQRPLEDIYATIIEALEVQPTIGSKRNSIQHVWGYFKKFATFEEKNTFQQLFQEDHFEALLPFLKKLAIKYDIIYLLDSTLLINSKKDA